jgi:hypothetical protein
MLTMNRDSNMFVRHRWSFVSSMFSILWVFFVVSVIDAAIGVTVALLALPIIAFIAVAVVLMIRPGSDRR